MGFLDKIFGKKDADLGLKDLDKSLGLGPGSPGSPDANLNLGLPQQGMSPYPNPSPFDPGSMPSAMQDQQAYTLSKEMEIISIKLDAIKVAIESLSQRLASLERATYGNQEQSQYSYAQPQQRYYRESPPRTY